MVVIFVFPIFSTRGAARTFTDSESWIMHMNILHAPLSLVITTTVGSLVQ